jgi:HK97 family phage prohead protease
MSKVIERRLASGSIEIRKSPDGKTVGVRGYAAVFDSESYGEVIRKSAFNRTIAQRDNVRLLVNHEGVPLASTKSGTMTIGVDERGQWFDAPALDLANPDVQRLVSAMERGDIDQCSFAGYFNDAPDVNGLREVREVTLVDNSIVTYPWYEETEVGLTGDRQGDLALVCLRSLSPEQRSEVLALLDERSDADDETPDPATERESDDPDQRGEPLVDEQIDDSEPAEKAAPLSISEARALLGLPAT